MGLEVATGDRDDLVVITLRGELDIYTVPGFRRDIGQVDAARIVLDLNEVTLLDSSGLGAIVALRARAAEGSGGVAIACERQQVLRVFDVTGLRSAFPIGSDVDAAIRALDETTLET
ncbi:MAG: STAS domain-containing protein [Actinomycetota bacterium]|nr:STAS domain-containing protein [Actinomycetota bacterium]